MAKSKEQILAALTKLYDRRSAIDQQILTTEENLVAFVGNAKTAAKAIPAKAGKTIKKVATTVKKAAGKPRGRKPKLAK